MSVGISVNELYYKLSDVIVSPDSEDGVSHNEIMTPARQALFFIEGEADCSSATGIAHYRTKFSKPQLGTIKSR